MSPNASAELMLEVERLLALPVSARESEGIYANETQLKLLQKRIKASGGTQLRGASKFVADFSSSSSRLLRLIDAMEGEGNG